LEAIRRLKAAKYEPKRTIHCLFVPDEEIGGLRGMKKLVKLEEFKTLNVGFILDEGKLKRKVFKLLCLAFFSGLASETDVFQVYYGDRSAMWIEITVKGNTGHGSRLIENTAAEKVQFLINEMLKYRTDEKERLEKSQTTDKPLQLGNITTTNLTKMSGGVQINVVPDQYTLGFDCRIKPDGYDSFKQFLNDLIKRVPKKDDNEVYISFLQDSGPLVLTDVEKPSWWLSSFKRSCDEMKCKLNWTVFPAGTDSRYLRNAGYPAIGFSPMIHTPVLLHDHNEYLDKDVFLNGIEIYVKLIENLTNEQSSKE
jgi:aminoacylase